MAPRLPGAVQSYRRRWDRTPAFTTLGQTLPNPRARVESPPGRSSAPVLSAHRTREAGAGGSRAIIVHQPGCRVFARPTSAFMSPAGHGRHRLAVTRNRPVVRASGSWCCAAIRAAIGSRTDSGSPRCGRLAKWRPSPDGRCRPGKKFGRAARLAVLRRAPRRRPADPGRRAGAVPLELAPLAEDRFAHQCLGVRLHRAEFQPNRHRCRARSPACTVMNLSVSQDRDYLAGTVPGPDAHAQTEERLLRRYGPTTTWLHWYTKPHRPLAASTCVQPFTEDSATLAAR